MLFLRFVINLFIETSVVNNCLSCFYLSVIKIEQVDSKPCAYCFGVWGKIICRDKFTIRNDLARFLNKKANR